MAWAGAAVAEGARNMPADTGWSRRRQLPEVRPIPGDALVPPEATMSIVFRTLQICEAIGGGVGDVSAVLPIRGGLDAEGCGTVAPSRSSYTVLPGGRLLLARRAGLTKWGCCAPSA